MEGGKEVNAEPGNETLDLDKIQYAKHSIAELWETVGWAVQGLIPCRHRLQQISKVAGYTGWTTPR